MRPDPSRTKMFELRVTENRGRGLFSLHRFAPGEVLEEAPVLVLPAAEQRYLDPSTLYHYYFAWGEAPEALALALGYLSFANHSYQPNARYIKQYATCSIALVALRPIEAGDEITVNYNGDPEDRSPLWFSVAP